MRRIPVTCYYSCMKRNERGFTVPELMVVIVLTCGAILVTAIFMQPTSYDSVNQDSRRQLGLAMLAQGFTKYKAKHGSFPAGIPTEEVSVGMAKNGYDICQALAPDYFKVVPLDPEAGSTLYQATQQAEQETVECSAPGLVYISGYKIRMNPEGSITFAAPEASDEVLRLTIR